jgi:hypothetical protein
VDVGGISSPGLDPRGILKLNSHERRAGLFRFDVLGRFRTLNASRMADRGSGVGEIGITVDDDRNACRCFLTIGL